MGSIRNEKTIVLALAIQLFIAAFSSFLVVGLVAVTDPGETDGGSIEVVVTGEASGAVLDAVGATSSVSGVEADPARAQAAFDRGAVDAVIRADRDDAGRLIVDLVVPAESIRSAIVVVRVREALEVLEQRERLRLAARLDEPPLAVPDAPGASPYFGFTYTVLVPLLLFLPAFISGSLVVDSITEEVERGTLALLRVTPRPFSAIIDGKLATAVGIVPLQAALWFALLGLNGIDVRHVPALLILGTAAATVLVSVGATIALVTTDRRRAQFLYSFGVIAMFALAVRLPEQPANAVARLAVDSPGPATWTTVGATTFAAVVGLVAVRTAVVRWRP